MNNQARWKQNPFPRCNHLDSVFCYLCSCFVYFVLDTSHP